jgi:amino acid transporter
MVKSWADNAPAPEALQESPHIRDSLSYRLKKLLLGKPLNRHTLAHQRLKKRYALGVLSSDPISSSAYGTEQILVVLVPTFGLLAFSMLMPMTAVVLVVLIIITLSYRNVISTYTQFGGAYMVARDNFRPLIAQIAAVALILDYVVTLAIQSAAGVAAIISAFPELHRYKIPMAVFIILFLAFGNLRGVKEAGKMFAFPTYLFIVSMFIVFIIGIIREIMGTLPVLDPRAEGALILGDEKALLTFATTFILLRAFANGGSSLTGLEAISDGVGLFKTPEYVNARRTLVIMSTILGTLVFGISYFAQKIYAIPYQDEAPTVISQVAGAILGDGTLGTIFFYIVQAGTMLILFAGANTTFNAFPIVVNYAAADGYLPRWLTKRGHRLNFSNGILVLTISALILVFVTGASVSFLVAFYALGVFTAFTISGLGMAKRNLKNKGKRWKLNFVVNGLAGSIAFIVVIVFSIVKFNQGAWVIVFLAPILIMTLTRLRRRYEIEQATLALSAATSRATSISHHQVAVLIDKIDIATVATVRYARSLKPQSIIALHFVIDDQQAKNLAEEWAKNHAFDDISLELIDCPDRRLANAAVDYAIRATMKSDVELTLLLPRRAYSRFLGRILHDQTAEAIARPISQLPRVVATIVPFDVDRMLSGKSATTDEKSDVEHEIDRQTIEKPLRAQSEFLTDKTRASHFTSEITEIGKITWRNRAHIQGRVTSLKSSPSKSAPRIDIEVWDESGGVTLQFLGRREIAGVEVGSAIRAEGMVGENEGVLTILNPSYEILD